MKHSITQSMSWLHTWAGLVLGWALVAIFVTGTLAVFDREITQWMQPEIPAATADREQSVRHAIDYLRQHHGNEARWQVQLPTERYDRLAVSAGEQRRGGGRGGVQTVLDPATGEVLQVRDTAGGNFFFRFHYTLHFPRNIGVWIVGFMAMAMLAAIVSGIIIHKKFFKEFFTFRPNKGQRSWLDYHNASGVLLLPFHIMITYTGLVIFFSIYMPGPMDALFNGDRESYVSAMRGVPVGGGRGEQGREGERTVPGQRGIPADGQGSAARGENGAFERGGGARPTLRDRTDDIDFMGLIALAEAQMGPISGFSLQRRPDGQATFEASPVLGNIIELTKGKSMVLDALSGSAIRAPAEANGASWVQRVIAGLHFAQFGGYPMRWLYFVCGLVSSAMMAGGLILFTVKRRRRYEKESRGARFGYEAIERINIAIVSGLLLASVGLLWANRVLPVELAGRAAAEVNTFFAIWGLSFLHASVRPWLQAWREQLWTCAALAVALPLGNLMAGFDLFGSGSNLYVEVTTVAFGMLMAVAALKVTDVSAVARPVIKAPREKLA
jgi:uncharacterized iron-regulated membrane protein